MDPRFRGDDRIHVFNKRYRRFIQFNSDTCDLILEFSIIIPPSVYIDSEPSSQKHDHDLRAKMQNFYIRNKLQHVKNNERILAIS